MKATFHKKTKERQKVTVKFDSIESFSLLLSFAKDGIVEYNKKADKTGSMYQSNLERIDAIDSILKAFEPSGSGLVPLNLVGTIEEKAL